MSKHLNNIGIICKNIAELKDNYLYHLTPSKTIGMTNGCFDIVHYGHIYSLEYCKTCCDKLIVFVNDDESVKLLKGNDRPINSLLNRMYLLSAIKYIDYIVPLHSTRLYGIFEELKPNVWFKGNDYTLDTLDQKERIEAEKNKVNINFTPLINGFSTSNIINTIKK